MFDTILKTQHSKHLISGGYNNNNEKKEGREEGGRGQWKEEPWAAGRSEKEEEVSENEYL